MSLGFIGYAKLKTIYDNVAIYSYSGENWNDSLSNEGDSQLFDGEFQLLISSLSEPEIHEKITKYKSRRKKVIKRIVQIQDINKIIENEEITVTRKCKNEFSRGEIDCYIASRLIYNIFEDYQINGKLPEKVSFIQ